MGLTNVQNDLHKLVGENVVLFVYRNVTAQSVSDAFKADFTRWIQDLTSARQAGADAGRDAGRVSCRHRLYARTGRGRGDRDGRDPALSRR